MLIPEPYRAEIAAFPEALRALIEAELAAGNSIVDAIRRGRIALDPVRRFEQSMRIDYEKWRDGIGYDLDAIAAASSAERTRIEALLLERGVLDWRDVEALAALSTPGAEAALREAASGGDTRVRNAVADHAPQLVSEHQRIQTLVASLRHDTIFAGLSQTLDAIATFHPAPVIDELFAGALRRPGEVSVHLAGMLLYVHGKADEPFDMTQRPFLLRFHAEPGSEERVAVFRELCARLGVDAEARLLA